MSKEEGGHASGRPPLYTDPLLMETKIDQYFDDREQKNKAPTIAGLCYFLGFEDRGALLAYEKRGSEVDETGTTIPGPFSRTVKRARLRIEADRAENLVTSGSPTAGLIFDMVNNHGYKNPQHIKHAGDDEDDTPIKNVTRIELVAPKVDDASD